MPRFRITKGMATYASLVAALAIMPRSASRITRSRDKVPIRTKGRRKLSRSKTGKLNFTTLTDLLEGSLVMSDTFYIHNQPTIILFDSGASHSFIGQKFSVKCQLPFCHTKGAYMIATPGGKVAANQLTRQVPIELGCKIFTTTLLILGLESVDIILETNWMTRHQVLIDVTTQAIEIHSPSCAKLTLYLPRQKCTNYCAFSMIESPLEGIHVVHEYADVFLENLPRMPPDRDIEFVIELQPGIAPITKRPYRMPLVELVESKKQLQELLDKDIIFPSTSPWVCFALFVNKKDKSLTLCMDYHPLNVVTIKTSILCHALMSYLIS
jgi:hypothetical protein